MLSLQNKTVKLVLIKKGKEQSGSVRRSGEQQRFFAIVEGSNEGWGKLGGRRGDPESMGSEMFQGSRRSYLKQREYEGI